MNGRNWTVVVIALVGAGLGYLLARHFPANTGSEDLPARSSQTLNSDSRDLSGILQTLTEKIDEESRKRQALEEQVRELRATMANANQLENSDTGDPATEILRERSEQSVQSRLVAAGFTPEQIDAIRRQEGEDRMRWIELDDTARREGWRNKPRYYEERAKLAASGNSLLEDLGAEAYDRYLFTTRKPNRVGVDSVFETSPAEQAGLRADDIIQSYAGQAVFSVAQLNSLRSGGEKGTPAIIEVYRDGQLIQLTMPRGPMGLRPRMSLVDPDAPSTEISYAVRLDD
jgi:hypothetical protein